MSKPDWQNIRNEFPALQNRAYLNTATFGQLPRRATEAVSNHWRHRDELACTDFLTWFSDADRLRGSIAKLINASPSDIAFTGSAADSLNIVVEALNLKPGEHIVTLQDEFPNYLYLPHVREVPWERFFESIDHNTRMVAISEVNYASGFRAPVEEISKLTRERGILLFVDGTQSAGALRVDVQSLGVDIYAVHAYKWMISPTGASFMAVLNPAREHLPSHKIGWRSHKTWRNVDNLHHGAPEFSDTAEKYEGGGLANALLYAMEQAVNLMLEIGPSEIEARVLQLADSVRARLRESGAYVNTGSQIVAAKFPGHDPSHLARELKAKNVNVAARHGFLRISPHFYNNEQDLDLLFETIKPLLK